MGLEPDPEYPEKEREVTTDEKSTERRVRLHSFPEDLPFFHHLYSASDPGGDLFHRPGDLSQAGKHVYFCGHHGLPAGLPLCRGHDYDASSEGDGPGRLREGQKGAGELPALYDCVFTAYEKTTSVDALVLGQGSVIGYSSNPKTNPEYIEKHLTEILQGNNVKRTVKIFKDYRKFETRVKEMAASESAGDEKRKNEKAVDVLKAIAL